MIILLIQGILINLKRLRGTSAIGWITKIKLLRIEGNPATENTPAEFKYYDSGRNNPLQ